MRKSTINSSRAIRRLLNITLLALLSCIGFSCSGNDDSPEVKMAHQISFNSTLSSDKSVTRAGELKPLHEIGINQFKVYGFKTPASGDLQTVFYNEAVNYTDVQWAYEMPRYWDLSAQDYMFFGYNPNIGLNTSPGTSVTVNKSGNTITYTCYSIPYIEEREGGKLRTRNPEGVSDVPSGYLDIQLDDVPFISHLWKNAPTPNQRVNLQFFAPYAKVSVAFSRSKDVNDKTTFIEGIHFKQENITTHAIYDHPDIAYTYTIDGTSEKGKESFAITRRQDHDLIFSAGFPFDDMMKTEKIDGVDTKVGVLVNEEQVYQTWPTYWTFPTGANEIGDMVLEASIGGELQSCKVPAEYTKWDMGYHYIYVFRISREGVDCVNVIKVGIKEWESIGSQTTEFYNW